MTATAASHQEPWPSLPLEAWSETCETLHLWIQIVGKVRLSQSPWVNHAWHVTLYVTARGLTTSPIPHGDRTFQIDSRPSDALALAVRSGAPIFAAEDVIAESAIEFEHDVEDTEEVVDRFKEFLDQVTPEDFAGESGE